VDVVTTGSRKRERGMRVAVFSDIHSNLEALESVLEHTFTKSIDRYVCLGDIVGYGANPNECIDLVKSLPDCSFLLGNHDSAVIGDQVNMNRDARKAIRWTREKVTLSRMWFLMEMKDVIKWGDVFFCHSNPYKPRNWHYVVEKSYISSSFARSKAKLLFIGHTHVPIAITRKNFFCVYIRSPQTSTIVPVAELNRQIFNCGSVGQPRDGDPRASYLIFDDQKQTIEFYRVAYNHELACRKILDAGLPEDFALRLAKGL
jgi:predicted phosphodiesterase